MSAPPARAALVTGSSSGIGRAIAAELARRGLAVAVSARTEERAQAAGRELGAAGALAADLTEPGAPAALVDRAAALLGRLDVLVNCAGAGLVADSAQLPEADWRRIVELDLTAPFLCAQAAARHMLRAGAGVIVNVSSVTGHVALPRRAAYSAAKHGLEGLTKALAIEWGRRGVRVVSVAPGYVHTELLEQTMAAGGFSTADVAARTPLGRLAEPAEVARVVAFLASDDAAYVTGSSVLVDGGWLADGGWEHA